MFRFDPNFEENEMLWEQIKKEILGDDDEGDDEAGNEEDGKWIPLSFCFEFVFSNDFKEHSLLILESIHP